MRLIEGQLIHRRYRLDSRLAQVGMGEVWKGFDIQLGRPVAITAVRTDTTNQESILRRLRAEARNSANLAHPNIAALFEYHERAHAAPRGERAAPRPGRHDAAHGRCGPRTITLPFDLVIVVSE